ncbi:MAG: hypothetical protein CME64_14025 [Halobacteriovoraceae bacterium]|nr:hypothetical protein [Halobacteriovoraceae bacterium]
MILENAIYILSTVALLSFFYFCIKPYFSYFEDFFLGETQPKDPLSENPKHLFLEEVIDFEIKKLKDLNYEQRENYIKSNPSKIKTYRGQEVTIRLEKQNGKIKVKAFPNTLFGAIYETEKSFSPG